MGNIIGCGGAQKVAKEDTVSILVHSGRGLPAADRDGFSDPLVICRIGKLGPFDQKPSSTEHRSSTIRNSLEPEWKLAFKHHSTSSKDELHVKVLDDDMFSPDDMLGEVRVPLETLLAHRNELRPYKLTGGPKAQGEIFLMAGNGAEQLVFDDVLATVGAVYTRGWADGGSWLQLCESLVMRLGELVAAPGMTFGMYANLATMARAWTRPAELDAPARQFRRWEGQDSYVWEGPMVGGQSITYSGHADVSRRLAQLGMQLGTNDANGAVTREHSLGWVPLNTYFWRGQQIKRLALSWPQEAHARARPHLVALFGPGGKWTADKLMQSANTFFEGRRSLAISSDVYLWTTITLHEIALGITLTTAEAEAFITMQQTMLPLAFLPKAALPALQAAKPDMFKEAYAQRQAWLSRAGPLLRKHLPATAAMPAGEMDELVAGVCDALVFAGGIAVPTAISLQLSTPYTAWGVKHLPKELDFRNRSQHAPYCWEILRRFPPVTIFAPFTERKQGGKTTMLNVGMAQRDPRVWGADAGEFKLRSLCDYHKLGIGFAEPALAPHLRSPNSHACPARDLSLAMMTAFMAAWVRATDDSELGVLETWLPFIRADGSDEAARTPAKPEDLVASGLSAPPITLRLQSGVASAGRSGAELLAMLGDEAKVELALHTHTANKFDLHTSAFTQAWMVAAYIARPSNKGSDAVSGDKFEPRLDLTEKNYIDAPFAGVKLCTVDENATPNWLQAVIGLSVRILNANLEYSEPQTADGLVYFETELEAIAAVHASFGDKLPPQFITWEQMDTDQVVADLCTHGLGAWCLRKIGAKDDNGRMAPVEDRAFPPGAVLEVDFSALVAYEVRRPWAPYGHSAFLSEPRVDGRCTLLGIWVAAEKRLALPTEGQRWEVAKAGFKSTLGTVMTAREHLLECHWLVANGLSRAARETTGAEHPLRRLLRPHYYNTAKINAAATDVLMPINSLGFRVFGFSEASWARLLNDLALLWQWHPFPERMANQGIPEAFPALPLYADGMLVWRAMEEHVRGFLAIWYKDDASLLADAEAVAFWRHFSTQTAHDGWGLGRTPTLNTLCSLLTGLIFEVTVGHEVVGAIVEFITSLHGMAPKLAVGKTVPDVQSFALGLCVISITGVKQPQLLDDWTHMYTGAQTWSAAQKDAAVANERAFQQRLELAAEEIEDRNEARERSGAPRYMACNPRILESSVSI